jgi:hypothetical protein
MERRQLLKALAALPLARVNYAYAAPPICSGTCNPVQNSLLAWLEGPFAVVLTQDNTGNPVITAFSPVDSDHLVNISSNKGVIKGAYPDQFHLSLQGDGGVAAKTACISSDFKDFCVDHLGNIVGNPDNSFVRVQLPTPKNIYTTELRKGTVGSGASSITICVPQDHVLEYETVSGSPITLVYEDKKQSLSPKKNVFHIEVGLPAQDANGNDTDRKGDLAKHFHNKTILAHFPSQNVPNKQLTDVSANRCPSTIPTEILNRLPTIRPRTTTLECKSGGIIGGSP